MMPRDYVKERRDYYGYGDYSSVTAGQKKHRREKDGRDEARARLKKEGAVKRGQDVHHKDGNPLNSKRSNLVAISRSKNRPMNKH